MKDVNLSNPSDESEQGPQNGQAIPNSLQHLDLAQKALDIAGVILIATDSSGNVMFLNRRGHEILEYPDRALIGKNWYETCLPERERDKVASALQQLMQEGVEPVGHFENWVVTQSGKELLIAWYNTVLTDEAGRCVGTLSSGEDITQRRQAEEAIQREKAFSDAIIDSLPGPFYVLNERGRHVRWNKIQEELIGLPPEKIPCMPSLATIHKDDRHEMMRMSALVFKEGYGTLEARQRDTGRTLCFIGKRMDLGNAQFLVGMALDLTDRKRAEETLRENEERFRGVVETSPDPIAVMEPHGRILMANRQAARASGYDSAEDALKHCPRFYDVVAPEDQARAAHEIRKVIVRGGPSTFEISLIRRDGSRWPGEVRCSVVRDQQGRPTSLITIARDITDRKRAEETLRESEERFRCVVETTPDAITVMDLHGRMLMANRQSVQLNGYDNTEHFLSHASRFNDVVAPKDRARAVSAVRKVLVQGGSHTFELSLVRRDGSRWPGEVRCSALRDSHGRPTGVITVARDITERKLAEQRQARSLRRLESVNRLQEDLLLPETLKEKFKRITEAAIALLDLDFCRIWVVEPGDLCNSGCIHATAADNRTVDCRREKCLHLLASAGRYTNIDGRRRRVPLGCCKIGRIAIDKERRFLTNNVTTEPHLADHQWAIDLGLVSFAGYKLHDTDGAPVGVLAVFAKHTLSEEDDAFLLNLSEITSKVILDSQARAELQETRRQAIAASEAKSEFLANMSHEIRTPMTAIMGFTDLLMSPNLSSEEQHEFLETIGRNGRSLLVLINDILDLSKIEAAKITVESMNYPLPQLIDDVLEVVYVRAQEKGLNLQVICDSTVPETIRTDPNRLRQILVNLMGNAIKFTEQGDVQLAIRKGEGLASTKLHFAISDTGIGIEADKLTGLFQPFAQADASTTRRFGGTGLGLAISKRLAHLLGGDIEVTSEFGRGSTFTLTVDIGSPKTERSLPTTPNASQPQQTPSRDDGSTTFQGRVLLAEDSPDLQRFLTHVLRRMHVEVELAENGQEACEKAVKSRIEANPFDLILMDMQMPEMDGLQATRWLRAHDWQGPIVAVTAHAMAEHRDGCLAAGCNDYLAKPVQVSELRTILACHLRRPAQSGLGQKATNGTPMGCCCVTPLD